MKDLAVMSRNVPSSSEESLVEFLKTYLKSTNEEDVIILYEKLAATSTDKRALILKGVQTDDGKTLMHHAALHNLLETVQCIKTHLRTEEFCLLVAQQDNNHWLPLHYAFISLRYGTSLEHVSRMVDELLDPFDVELRCKLIEKAVNPSEDVSIWLTKMKAPSLVVEILCGFSQPKVLDMLLRADSAGNTAFHWLVYCLDESGHTQSLLSAIPAERTSELLTKQNSSGQTPLYIASQREGKAFATLLSKERESLDYFVESWIARKVWYPARGQFSFVLDRLSDQMVLKVLKQALENGDTLFQRLVAKDDVETVKAIHSRLSPDHFHSLLTVRNCHGRGPLHHAAITGRRLVFFFIIKVLPCERLATLLTTSSDIVEMLIGLALKQMIKEENTIPLQKFVDAVRYSATGQHKRGDELEDGSERKTRLNEDQPEVISLREKFSELEREGRVKDTQVEALTAENAELRLRSADVERQTPARAEQDPLEIISLQERVSELEREVQVKDSQLKELQAKIDELEVKVKTTEGSQADESEEEGSFDSSEEDSLTFTDYTNSALPEELHQAILDLCQRRKVDRAKVLQGPLNYKDVTVVGVGVDKTGDGDLSELREKWSEHCSSISVREESSGDNSSRISKFMLSQPAIEGVCELVVIVEHAELGQTAYLVGTAQCVLPEQPLEHLINGTAQAEIRQQLDVDARGCHYRVLFRPRPNEEEFVDAFPVPLFGYRCKQANAGASRMYNDINLHQCRNDMALLRIDPTKANDLYRVFNDLPGRREHLVEISTQNKLKKYTRPPRDERDIRIYVKEHYGSLTFSRNADGQLAPGDLYHLRFVLDNNEQIGPGDYGSVVYQVGTRGWQRSLRPLGLLIGRSEQIAEKTAESTIYLAVFIDLAFQDIKGEYGEVNGIRLMHAHLTQPREVRPGEQNLPALS